MSSFWLRSRRPELRVLGVALALALPAGAAAQLALPASGDLVARADTFLIAGRIFAAESLYYVAVRQDPRNPVARLALGRYLAARGALKVGATLMEEARYFGGDPATVAEELAPVYQRLGDYGALAALPGSPLPVGERRRAEWLRDHPPGIDGPDSGAVSYIVSDSHLLGRVSLIIGSDTVPTTIDARVQGLVLDTSWARHAGVRTFAASRATDPRSFAGVVTEARLGAFTVRNVVTSFAPQRPARSARVGVDVLGALAPTFDPRGGRLLLRKSGRVPDQLAGWRIATLMSTKTGLMVVKGETVFPLGHPDVQQYLGKTRWTVNARRGEIVVEPVDASQGTY